MSLIPSEVRALSEKAIKNAKKILKAEKGKDSYGKGVNVSLPSYNTSIFHGVSFSVNSSGKIKMTDGGSIKYKIDLCTTGAGDLVIEICYSTPKTEPRWSNSYIHMDASSRHNMSMIEDKIIASLLKDFSHELKKYAKNLLI